MVALALGPPLRLWVPGFQAKRPHSGHVAFEVCSLIQAPQVLPEIILGIPVSLKVHSLIGGVLGSLRSGQGSGLGRLSTSAWRSMASNYGYNDGSGTSNSVQPS